MPILDRRKDRFVEDRDTRVSVGIDFPFARVPNGDGYFQTTKTTVDAIKNNIKLLLKTNKSERVFQPNLGMGLKEILFEPLNDDTTHIVYTLGCENKQIDMNGITFSDYFETDHQELLLKQQDEFDFTGIDDGDYNMYREQKQIDKLNGKLTQSGFYSTLQ